MTQSKINFTQVCTITYFCFPCVFHSNWFCHWPHSIECCNDSGIVLYKVKMCLFNHFMPVIKPISQRGAGHRQKKWTDDCSANSWENSQLKIFDAWTMKKKYLFCFFSGSIWIKCKYCGKYLDGPHSVWGESFQE